MYLKNTLQICSKITSNQFIAQFHLLNVIKSKKKNQQLYIWQHYKCKENFFPFAIQWRTFSKRLQFPTNKFVYIFQSKHLIIDISLLVVLATN